ncbi:MAG TPA: hypothetical protein DCZ92_02450 [Elusimicrobia bacterium]|nr:MAG: hypothetical protein A2016_00310 [Elusimicrobia bacterium GWF2_62_30]HBA59685.1 hypothetical protein [Elusimicrobiota bacterium]
MKRAVPFLFLLLVLAQRAPAAAQTLPDLKNQSAWKEKDKQEFLKYLKSDQPTSVTGQVKAVAAEKGGGASRKARYLTLDLFSDSLITVSGTGKRNTCPVSFGPQLMAGGHLFSWIRYYAGLKYNHLRQDKLDGTSARLEHFEFPVGIELALIPLGTPHTRYALLRFGVSEHRFGAKEQKASFETSVLGWHHAWNAAIGYEWQISESRWRAHFLAEGYRSFRAKGTPEFTGAGLTGGLAYTF